MNVLLMWWEGGSPPRRDVYPPPSLLEEGEGHRPNPKGRSEGIYK